MSRVIDAIRLTHADYQLSGTAIARNFQLPNLIAFDGIEPPLELTPTQKLFLAILNDAINTLKRGKPTANSHQPSAYSQTHSWLMSDSDDYCVCSFVLICETFGWAPSWIRKKIQKAITERTGGKLNRMSVRGQYCKVSCGKSRHA